MAQQVKKIGNIYRKGNIYRQGCDFAILEWDQNGRYRGQWQIDITIDVGPPRMLFTGTDPSDKYFVADLTKEEMAGAI